MHTAATALAFARRFYVKGGGLSVGDLHFSQGDGEITFCGAIEMAGWSTCACR